MERNFGDLNKTQEEYLTDVYQGSQHLLFLVNKILDVSKIEAGKLELSPTEINVKDMLEQSVKIITDKTFHRHIHLSVEIDQIPETITADAVRMKQIRYNLLSNTVRFTDDGGSISIGARVTADADRQNQLGLNPVRSELEISVVDTGIGIRKEDIVKIFEPFSQL